MRQEDLSWEGSLKGKRAFFAPSGVDEGPNDGARAPTTSPSTPCLLITDEALLEEAARFSTNKFSVSNGHEGGGTLFLPIVAGCFVGKTNSLIYWSKQDKAFF